MQQAKCKELNLMQQELKNSERQVKVMINNIDQVKELSFYKDKIYAKFN